MTHTQIDSDDVGRRFCDLVMKGGITSGVVFPKAVARLSHQYRFRNIGGASAGAIAAAGAAAAEPVSRSLDFARGGRRANEPIFSVASGRRSALPLCMGNRGDRGWK